MGDVSTPKKSLLIAAVTGGTLRKAVDRMVEKHSDEFVVVFDDQSDMAYLKFRELEQKKQKPSLVISEYRTPGTMNAAKLAAEIKQRDASIPFIMTASDYSHKAAGEKAGLLSVMINTSQLEKAADDLYDAISNPEKKRGAGGRAKGGSKKTRDGGNA